MTADLRIAPVPDRTLWCVAEPGTQPPRPGAGPLLGHVDTADMHRVEGWARDPSHPDRPVELELLDNDAVVARFRAGQYRADLEQAGIGDGRCAFVVTSAAGWSAAGRPTLRVRRASDGAELAGSPVTLERAAGISAGLRDTLAATLRATAAAGEAEFDTALRFLVSQADLLLRARADAGAAGGPATGAAAFYGRWGGLLPDPVPPVPRRKPPHPAAFRRRALAVTEALAEAAVPPLSDGLARLVRCGYEVTVATGEPSLDAEQRAPLEAEAMVCAGPPLNASVEETLRRNAGLFDLALLHGTAAALSYAALARRHQPRARLLLSIGELESTRAAQRAAAEERPELAAHAARLRTQESIAAWSVDAVLTASAADAAELRAAVRGAEVHVLDDANAPATEAGLAAALRLAPSTTANRAGRAS